MTLSYTVYRQAQMAGGGHSITDSYDAMPAFRAYDGDGDWEDDDYRLDVLSPGYNGGNPDSAFNDLNGTRNDAGAFGGPGGDW